MQDHIDGLLSAARDAAVVKVDQLATVASVLFLELGKYNSLLVLCLISSA
jgi:hypothetical protein